MRLIDADELREQCDDPFWCVWLGDIDNAPTIDAVPEWIPVTERLPATDDHVLAATQNKAGRYNIVKAYYSHDLHCWASGMNSNVTHWMPLPEPPKGERKDDE